MSVTRIGVMVGSPGDAAEERAAISDTIARWNAVYARERNVLLEAVKWETHSTPGLGGRPQGMINEELIPLSHCLVAVFRTRAGSDTGVEISGTIEEIKEFLKTGKHVSVYFYGGPVMMKSIDPDQVKMLQSFKGELHNEKMGLTADYDSVENLKVQLLAHLGSIVAKVLPAASDDIAPPPKPKKPKTTAKAPKRAEAAKTSVRKAISNVIDGSEDWCLLNNRFFQFVKVGAPDDRHFTLKLESQNSENDSALEELRPHAYAKGKPVPFAYANDAFVVRCESVTSSRKGKTQTWQLSLVKEDVEYGGGMAEMSYRSKNKNYSVDELAKLRAGRILLGDPPPPSSSANGEKDLSGSMLEAFIQGINTPLRIVNSPIQVLARATPELDSVQFLRFARLVCMFNLKAGGVVERIEYLGLGPLKAESVHVKFRGLRRKKYSNVPASVIEIEGECRISSPPT